MSYWDEIEASPRAYRFQELDEQIERIREAGGVVTLCLGARQPRWPENHWPDWAWELPPLERTEALMDFIEVVMRRYRHNKTIISWQLENEALLQDFGERVDVDRQRLKAEFALVFRLDKHRPIIMTTSTSWGIPVRWPIPDIVGFSYYRTLYNKGRYRKSIFYPWAFRLRAGLVRLLHGKPCFIHELQLEPWGPKNIWEMPVEEQNISMGPDNIRTNLQLAQKTKLYPIDLWGGEWWYWRKVKCVNIEPWETIEKIIR